MSNRFSPPSQPLENFFCLSLVMLTCAPEGGSKEFLCLRRRLQPKIKEIILKFWKSEGEEFYSENGCNNLE